MKKKLFFLSMAVAFFFAPTAQAQSVAEDVPRHPDIPTLGELLADYDMGKLTLDELRAMGLSVFATPFNNHDGLGDGPFDAGEVDPIAFGHRPTLQGNGTFLRVNGLDAQSCNECHTTESNRTNPPTLGIGGIGTVVQNAIIMASLIDVGDSFDDRVAYQPGHEPDLPLVFDGVADYNGRFSNPPFLYGGGGVELLAKEMTEDLQRLLAQARIAPAGTVIQLDTHGVNFGSMTSLGGGDVQLDVEGIGPEDITGLAPEEVLVVRPFGRKGENFSMRDFDRGAMQFHFGIQPVEVVGEDVDEDGDGVFNEVTVAEMSVLHIFDVTNPRPFMDKQDAETERGLEIFMEVDTAMNIGCADCHIPVMETRSNFLPLAHPEVASNPNANTYFWIDLTKDVGADGHGVFEPAPDGGVYVPLFSDLKRHRMGDDLAETFERGELIQDEFITARLWGIADTGPYLHDGRATTLYQAIEYHGGEAKPVRDAFLNLPADDQSALIRFLLTLRTPEGANTELAKAISKVLY
jgi:hypothetical protein